MVSPLGETEETLIQRCNEVQLPQTSSLNSESNLQTKVFLVMGKLLALIIPISMVW